jgi:hypothetical protein
MIVGRQVDKPKYQTGEPWVTADIEEKLEQFSLELDRHNMEEIHCSACQTKFLPTLPHMSGLLVIRVSQGY